MNLHNLKKKFKRWNNFEFLFLWIVEHLYKNSEMMGKHNCFTAPLVQMITCLFKASKVSSLRSLLAVILIFPKSDTPNSFSIVQKNFLASQDRYARSPESNLMPTALYLHKKSSKTQQEKYKQLSETFANKYADWYLELQDVP